MDRLPIEEMKTVVGAFAELAHMFYKAMRQSGASRREALEGMGCFMSVLWGSSMNGRDSEED